MEKVNEPIQPKQFQLWIDFQPFYTTIGCIFGTNQALAGKLEFFQEMVRSGRLNCRKWVSWDQSVNALLIKAGVTGSWTERK